MLSMRGLHIDQAPPLSIPFRFFTTAPLFLILCGVGLMVEGSVLLDSPLQGATVAVVHMITLGWIAMVMFGAMYQMIPVLGGGPVPWIKGAVWVHLLLVVGVLSFYLGVGLDMHAWFLLVASFALAGAVLLFVVPVGLTLIRSPVNQPTIWAMRIALICLIASLVMGLIFLGEYAHGFLEIDRFSMLGVHLVWTLFGWIGTLMVGVSFHVLPMFYMMPVFPQTRAYGILVGLTLTWILLPLSLLLVDPMPLWLLWLSALPALVAMTLYGITMWGLFQSRKRKKWDPTLRLWQVGYINVVLALVVLALWTVSDDVRVRYLFGVLFLIGWTSSAMIGMLYRIVPFLTWFHRYSHQAGVPGVPMMEDLTPPKVGQIQLWNQWVTLGLLIVAVFTGWDFAVRLGGISLCVAGGLLLYLLYFAQIKRGPQMG